MNENVSSLPRLRVVPVLMLLAVSSLLVGPLSSRAGEERRAVSADVAAHGAGVDPAAPTQPQASKTNATTTAPATTRWTVDSGGITVAGGDLELSGTIGQPDAGVAGGGDFTLVGGFWFPLSDGDCNTDGTVDLNDYSDLQPCFAGPGAAVPAGCSCFDVDQDGDVDLTDVAMFQQAYTGR